MSSLCGVEPALERGVVVEFFVAVRGSPPRRFAPWGVYCLVWFARRYIDEQRSQKLVR